MAFSNVFNENEKSLILEKKKKLAKIIDLKIIARKIRKNEKKIEFNPIIKHLIFCFNNLIECGDPKFGIAISDYLLINNNGN